MTDVNAYFGGDKSPITPKKESNKFADSQRAIYLRNWCNAAKGRTSALAAIVFDHCPKKSNSLSHYKYGRFAIQDGMWDKIKKGITKLEKAEKDSNTIARPLNTKSSFTHVTKEEQLDKSEVVEATEVVELDTPKAESLYELSAEDIKAVEDYFTNNTGTLQLFSIKVGREVQISDFKHDKQLHLEFGMFVVSVEGSKKLNALGKEVEDTRAKKINDWLSTNRKVKQRLANVVYVHNFLKSRSKEKDYTSLYFTHQLHEVEKTNRYIIGIPFDDVCNIINKVDALIEDNHPFAIAAAISK